MTREDARKKSRGLVETLGRDFNAMEGEDRIKMIRRAHVNKAGAYRLLMHYDTSFGPRLSMFITLADVLGYDVTLVKRSST